MHWYKYRPAAYTLRAPARAANMDKIPVPHPTSNTTFPSSSAACPSPETSFTLTHPKYFTLTPPILHTESPNPSH